MRDNLLLMKRIVECEFSGREELEALIIGGNLRDGIGMADRIKQGKHLADMV
jgi:hypothetical protein